MKTFRIITLGCKVNQYESAYLAEMLAASGLEEAAAGEKADIAVVNTCIVTQRASYQSRQAVRRMVRENPGGIIAAAGCYAQVFPSELSTIEGLHLIAGNTAKADLPGILTSLENRASSPDGEFPLTLNRDFVTGEAFRAIPVTRFPNRTRAFLKIQDGCRSFCSYCIVPFARGPLRSLSPPEVLDMVALLSKRGYKEVVLTGIHLGKYGADLPDGIDLKVLLSRIGDLGLPLRVRLSSLDPNEIDEEMIDMVSTDPRLCRHFHIPLQSGDDGILGRMNRRYRVRNFARLVDMIRERIPYAAVGADIMVGFPGETDRAHMNTVSLIAELPVSYLHVFPFSARKGTTAASFSGQVDPGIIKHRTEELRRLGQEKRLRFYRSCLGHRFRVLAEGWASEGPNMIRGVSDNYLPILFPSNEPVTNRMVDVHAESVVKEKVLARPYDLLGAPCTAPKL